MFGHVKIICLSVGLLLVLSELNRVSFAESKPVHEAPPATPVSAAQGSLGLAFWALAGT